MTETKVHMGVRIETKDGNLVVLAYDEPQKQWTVAFVLKSGESVVSVPVTSSELCDLLGSFSELYTLKEFGCTQDHINALEMADVARLEREKLRSEVQNLLKTEETLPINDQNCDKIDAYREVLKLVEQNN